DEEPAWANSGPAGPRSDAAADSIRSVTLTRRTRRRSASNRFGLTASGHQGPSVSIGAPRGTNAAPAPIAASAGAGVGVPFPTNTQLSPASEGVGPYVVQGPAGSVSGRRIVGG